MFRSACRLLSAFFLSVFPVLGIAAEQGALPQPLTLDLALQYVEDSGHFQVQSVNENLQQALAETEQARSNNDFRVNLSGRLSKVGVSELGDPEEDNDSVVSLFVRKPLYDFGKTSTRDQLAILNVELRQLEKEYLLEQRSLSIAQKYFDVLHADNEYLRHNEDLAIGYIRYDRARENRELGLSSELEVMESQAAYEVIRQNRANSENLQRYTRYLLAEELGFPDSPPSELTMPELVADRKIGDDVNALAERAFRRSLLVKIQHKKVEIARQQIEMSRHITGPTLDAELEFSEYARDGSTRDDWRASVFFDIPLYAGSTEKSAVSIASARHRRELAEYNRVRSEMRLKVLQLWQAIRQSELRLSGSLVNQEFRDMTLDRSRAEYELEFKTDLGDSMVQFSESRMQTYQARFELEMAWRRLQALVGTEISENKNSN